MAKRILIIEDELNIAKVLAKRLSVLGYEIRHAPDGTLGVREAHQFKPALILLDLMMPAGGGLFVLRALQDSMDTSVIPVIVLSGMPNQDDKQRVLEFDLAAYIEKPYDSERLIAEIKRVLDNVPSLPAPSS